MSRPDAGPARRDGAGAPGRCRDRSPAARHRSTPASRRRSPRRPSTRSAPPASARSASSTARSAPVTSRSPSAAAWSRCRRRRTCFPARRFGFRMGDAKALDAMVARRPHQPVQRQADVRRGDRGRRRARDDPRRPRPLGAALARAHDRGHRRRAPARGDRPRDDQGPQGRHDRRDRRGAAPRVLARGARRSSPG